WQGCGLCRRAPRRNCRAGTHSAGRRPRPAVGPRPPIRCAPGRGGLAMSGQARRSTDRLEPRSVLRLAYAAYNQSVAEAPAWRLPEAVAARSTDRHLLRQVVLTAEAAGF